MDRTVYFTVKVIMSVKTGRILRIRERLLLDDKRESNMYRGQSTRTVYITFMKFILVPGLTIT